MTSIAIRPASPADSGAIADLISQLEFAVGADDVAERLALMGTEVLVAELDGAVIGCLSTSIMRVLHRPAAVGRISMMVVDAGSRNRGIGAQLVRAAEETLRAQGCYMVEVTSHMRRGDAHRFYERLGYEKTSVRLMRML